MNALTPTQEEAIQAQSSSFWLGSAGCGKTMALHQRLLRLLADGEPAYTILTLVAEPEHQQAFLEAVHQSGLGPYADLKILTYNRLAQEMVELFWPLVARDAGFDKPYQPPSFLSYDLAQLLMWHVISPMFEEGAFADLRLRPQQIVSQLLDTLNRAALNRLSLDEAIERQVRSWVGEPERLVHLNDAAEATRRFREHCVEHSILDLSLVIQVFDTQVVEREAFHKYFRERFRHLLVDNIEEHTPAGQHFVHQLMNETETTAVSYDAGGGYKRFLSADPLGANQFYTASQLRYRFDEHFVTNEPLAHLANVVENYLQQTINPTQLAPEAISHVVRGRYRREMVANLMPILSDLIEQDGVPPSEIAIIVPYLDGALRYMLIQAFKEAGLPARFLRRRSSPRDEPRIRAWLTWLALAHPEREIPVSPFEVEEALTLSIDGFDPARAALLVDALFLEDPTPLLLPITELSETAVERIGETLVELYEELRLWLAEEAQAMSIEAFLYGLFNGLLAQPRFQPEPDLAGAAVCDWLVKAAQRLRQSAERIGFSTSVSEGIAFIDGIRNGLVTANPPELGDPPDPEGILVSTIYGYLLGGKSVDVQVWLETAASGWWDIPNQPLSNAFVLAQSFDLDQQWTAENDFAIRNELLSRIVRGLTARCRQSVVLANSDLDRRGLRQDGPLWRAISPLI
ncbi:MAG: UvrD-helicase domain-containing protein [Chloroflexota bacterium]